MYEFLTLKAMQTAGWLTAAAVTVIFVNELVRHLRQRPLPDGFLMGVGVMLKSIAILVPYTWLAIQYWVHDADHIIVPPFWARVSFLMFSVTGGGIFLALAQPWFRRAHAFLVWMAISLLVVAAVFIDGLT